MTQEAEEKLGNMRFVVGRPAEWDSYAGVCVWRRGEGGAGDCLPNIKREVRVSV